MPGTQPGRRMPIGSPRGRQAATRSSPGNQTSSHSSSSAAVPLASTDEHHDVVLGHDPGQRFERDAVVNRGEALHDVGAPRVSVMPAAGEGKQ